MKSQKLKFQEKRRHVGRPRKKCSGDINYVFFWQLRQRKNALNCFYKELIFSDIKRHKLRENKFLVSETLFHQYSVFTVLLMAFTTIKLLCNFIFLLDRFFFDGGLIQSPIWYNICFEFSRVFKCVFFIQRLNAKILKKGNS